MATQHDAMSRDRQPSTNHLELVAPDLHDFSDLRNTDGQPNHMLRWVVAIAAVFVAGHLIFSPGDMASRTQVSTTEASVPTSL